MSYQLVKNKFGTSNREIIFDVDIEHNINDFCYVSGLGYIFVLRDCHCLALLDETGKLSLPWLGSINKEGYSKGKGQYSRLSYPSSITYCKSLNKCFLIEKGGCSVREISLNSDYISSSTGKSSIKQIEDLITKFHPSEIDTIACVDDMARVYWIISVINKGFVFNRGDVRFWIGSGKQGYSVCSSFKRFSFNEPRGLVSAKDRIYLADTGNHCIREIMKDKIKLVAGDPEGKGFINNPSCLCSARGRLYFIDGNEVKYYSVSNGDNGTIYQGQEIVFIAANDHEDLLILEKHA